VVEGTDDEQKGLKGAGRHKGVELLGPGLDTIREDGGGIAQKGTTGMTCSSY